MEFMLLRYINQFAIILTTFTIYAQDTLTLTIQQADSLFLKNNYQLLAQSMHIEAQKAQIIQAKLYPNPVFTADFNAYDPENNRYFHVGQTGHKAFQLEQLILLGGKRKAEIDLAKTQVAIAEIAFTQLVRQLKSRLHSDLFHLGELTKLINRYQSQLELLDNLLNTYNTQAEKGNIPLKDVVRLKTAYLQLNNDRAELLKDYYELQNSVQTILQTNAIIVFESNNQDLEKFIQVLSLEQLHETAKVNRPDLLILEQNKLLAQQYLAYQKRSAVPDITLFTAYDQRSGAFNNQINAGFSIPLPLWNHNKGNIKTSQYQLKEVEYTIQGMQSQAVIELQNALSLYNQTITEYQKAMTLYNEDFEIILNGMIENFQKHNISLIEFIDFFESYNDGLNEIARIKTQLVTSAQQINTLTGKDIY